MTIELSSIALEFITWLVITVIVFYVFNSWVKLRTAASIILSFLIASSLITFIYNSMFSEIMLNFSIIITILYGIFRATRDFRDDCSKNVGKGNDSAT